MRSVLSLLASLAFLSGCASSGGTPKEITPQEANLLGRIAELEGEVEARDHERARAEDELAERDREVADLNERLSRLTRRQQASANRCEPAAPVAQANAPQHSDTGGHYVVQIGAFRRAPGNFGDRAEKIGTLSTSTTPTGVIRLQVGDYPSEREAREAQSRLKAEGYVDAFVRRADPVTAPRSGRPAVGAGPPLTPPSATGLLLGPG